PKENLMNRNRLIRYSLYIAIVLTLAAQLFAQAQLPVDLREMIDQAAADALAKSGVPSASVAVVKDGQIVYLKAYGDAKLEPKTPAASAMRYSIGSISNQFTAASILLLQERGKLLLDDKVSKFIP